MRKLAWGFVILFSYIANAQTISATYSVNFNREVYKSELLMFDNESYWVDRNDGISVEEKQFFVKKFNENKLYFQDNVFSQKFYIVDSLHHFKWQLKQETKEILGYKCNAAQTHFRGRNYTAYYAIDVASSDGPWKFGGLPGLILDVKSEDGLYSYQANEIKKNIPITYEKISLEKYDFLSWEAFVIKFDEFMKNMIKMARSNGTISDYSRINIKIDAPEIIHSTQGSNGADY